MNINIMGLLVILPGMIGAALHAEAPLVVPKEIATPQPVPGVDRAHVFDRGFPHAQAATVSRVRVGANPAVLPRRYTNFVEWTPFIHVQDYTAGFNVDAGAQQLGRSGAFTRYDALYHGGQGDLFGDFASGILYSRRPGATHYLASPALLQSGFQFAASVDGGYLQQSEGAFVDNGHAIAVIDRVRNFYRTNADAPLGQIWGVDRPQSLGSKPIDFVLAPSGPFRRLIDTAATDLGQDGAAIVLKQGERIYLRAAATADAQGQKFISRSLGEASVGTDARGNIVLVNGSVSLAVGNGGVAIDGIRAFASNAAAVSAGLVAGDIYRQGDFLAVVH